MSDTPEIIDSASESQASVPETTDNAVDSPRLSPHERATRRRVRQSALPGDRVRVVAIAAAALAAVLILGAVIDIVATDGRVHPGVRVGDVSVGSMKPADARDALRSAFSAGSAKPVTAAFGGKTWSVTADEIGVVVDATASIDAAMAVGRSGDTLAMTGERIKALFLGLGVPMLVEGDAEKAGPVLDAIAKTVAIPARDASVTVTGVEVEFVKSAPGRRLDRDATLAAISTAFVTTDGAAEVVVASVVPAVADADAQQALADARELVSGPVKISFEKAVHDVAQDRVAGWVTFTTVPYVAPAMELSEAASSSADSSQAAAPGQRMVLVAVFDPTRLGATLAPFTGGIGRPARDASFVAEKGKVKISPSQVGYGPDLAGLATDLVRACLDGTRAATLRLSETQPKLTTEAAKAMGVSDRISTFTTTYSSADKARVNNVHTLADAFNYKLIPPGGTFSFNGTAGQRTAAKGYQEAPAIVDGKLVPQLGGGVCQVGTTFFNTVFFAGLPVVERHNHSFYISHYPKGRDATVSWGGPDFKFKNDTAGWILVRAGYTNTSLTIALYGTDPGYTVKYTTAEFTNVKPHKVIEKKDPTLRLGKRVVEDGGVDGCSTTVVRTVMKGTEVVRKDTFASRYSAKDETVRVGTKPPASTPPTTTPTP